jgi:hypothetical protein
MGSFLASFLNKHFILYNLLNIEIGPFLYFPNFSCGPCRVVTPALFAETARRACPEQGEEMPTPDLESRRILFSWFFLARF